MAGETPITTATARVLVVADMTEFEESKRKIEQDIAALGEKFRDAFKVSLDGFAEQISREVEKLESAKAGGGGNQEKVLGDERPDNRPDQLLIKVTELQSQVGRIEQSLEEISVALTSGGP